MSHPEPFFLSYLPLLIRLQCDEPAQLPSFLGSALHGVIGWKLLNYAEDAYRYLFENRRYGGGTFDIANPYVLEIPRPQTLYQEGDMLSFRLILIGDAQRYFQRVVEGLTSDPWYGIGARRKKFKIVDIWQAEKLEPIWRAGSARAANAAPEKLRPLAIEKVSRCSIHLITPLRIRRGGEHVKELDFPTVIRNITQRLTALTARYGGHAIAEAISAVCQLAESVRLVSSGLYWAEISRYSNRRNMKMDLGGLLGALTFEGDLSPFVPWLHAAKILHIGRNVTFGCGQLDVVFG